MFFKVLLTYAHCINGALTGSCVVTADNGEQRCGCGRRVRRLGAAAAAVVAALPDRVPLARGGGTALTQTRPLHSTTTTQTTK